MPALATAAPDHYRADMQRCNEALQPFLLTDGDWTGIGPTTAPPALLGLYARLTSTGYANGWIKP